MDYLGLEVFGIMGVLFALVAHLFGTYARGGKIARIVLGGVYGLLAGPLAGFMTAVWWFAVVQDQGGLKTLRADYLYSHTIPLAALVYILQLGLGHQWVVVVIKVEANVNTAMEKLEKYKKEELAQSQWLMVLKLIIATMDFIVYQCKRKETYA